MNKGTAIVGFLLCFLAGMGLMYGIDRSEGVDIAAEPTASSDEKVDHSASPIPVTSKDPQWGNKDAPVTIVEISDFQCPFCSRVNPTVDKIKKEYGPEKVRVVWKHNPLPFHKKARPAHEAAAAVHALGGDEAFWKFHDLAFDNQKALTEDNFQKWAAAAGVDAQKFKKAFKAKKFASKVDKDLALAKEIGARGTPNFRINGVELSGAQPFKRFKSVIDQQLKAAQEMLDQGKKPSELYVALSKKNHKKPSEKKNNKKKKKKRKQDTTVWKVPVFDDDPVKGPDDALVTIVEWSDFQCPFCSRVEPTLDKVREEYGDDVRIVWKDNALPFHKNAKPAANLARVAYDLKGDKGFWKAHGLLFDNQKNLGESDLKKYASQLGLPWPAVKNAIDNEKDKYSKKIASSMELGSDLKARGTPHFFINGRRLSGAQPYEKFKALIDKRLKHAKMLVKKGTPRSKVYEEILKNAKGPPEPDKKDVPLPKTDHPFKGNPNAKVVIQEFSDFQCPYCKRVTGTVDRIVKEYGDRVKVVWRHLPLKFHKDAPLAAEAAQEAFDQKGSKGFWEFHDKLFANQKNIKRDGLEQIAEEMGLNMTEFKAALDSREHKKAVERDKAVAQKAGVRGTPAFVVGDYFLSGAQPFPKFAKLIKLALDDAK